MTMRDLHNNITHVTAVAPQTIAGTNLQSGNIDLAGFNAAEVVAFLGDIDELGASPVGAAKLEVKIEHADDDGTGSPGAYANVGLADVLGPSSVSGGIVANTTGDNSFLEVGYLGDKRFIRVTLVPTGLTNGGPVAAWIAKASPRHVPK
jgi:hypothetical protein